MKATYRPPIDKDREQMLIEIMDFLNTDTLIRFTLHDALNKCIDRAYLKTFPGRKTRAKKQNEVRKDRFLKSVHSV